MTNYREILRLNNLGLNNSQIAEACGCSRTTVMQTLRLARDKSISYPLPKEMYDKELMETFSLHKFSGIQILTAVNKIVMLF